MTDHEFPTTHPVHLYVEIGSGTIRVETTTTSVSRVSITGHEADRVRVELDGDDLSVVAPKHGSSSFGADNHLDVEVVVPTSSDLATKTGSADLVARGTLGTVSLKSGSGDIDLERVGGAGRIEVGSGDISIADAEQELRLKSGSGQVVLARTGAEVTVSTGSGDVAIGRSEAAALVKTGTGDLRVTEAHGDLALSTGSGDLAVETLHRGRVTVKAASGEVRLGIPAGVPVWTDISTLTGRISSTVQGSGQPAEDQDHVEVRATTVSGDITLTEK